MTIQLVDQAITVPTGSQRHVASREPVGRAVVWTAAITALGGLLFGYDTGAISGALIFIQKSFALSTFHQELNHFPRPGMKKDSSLVAKNS